MENPPAGILFNGTEDQTAPSGDPLQIVDAGLAVDVGVARMERGD